MNDSATSLPMAANSPFRPTVPHQAVATLLLIENSQVMSYMWPDLRDRYLPSLATKFENSNPIAILVQGSLPTQEEQSTAIPRKYNALQNGLHDFRFNYESQNRLSVGKIASSADILASTRFSGLPVSRHLVIVAASTPLDDYTGVNFSPYIGRSPWHRLAQKLAQADIQCHMVLGSSQDMTSMVTLFEETLRLRNSVEEFPSFPVDSPNFRFYLSAGHKRYPSPAYLNRGIPRRNQTFPSDSYSRLNDGDTFLQSTPTDSSLDTSPSLVSQLQQVHGLTKKKVYGTKPARLPFFREERVHDKHRGVAAPIPAPVAMPPTPPSEGGRAVSRSRAERIIRVAGGSPTDSHSRRQLSARRGPRFSSPEAERLISPSVYNIPLNISASAPSVPNADMHMSSIPVVPEPAWLQSQYSPVVPLVPQAQLPMSPLKAQLSQSSHLETRWQPDANDLGIGVTYSEVTSLGQPLATAPYVPSVLTESPRQETENLHQTNDLASTRQPKTSRFTRADDEVPFTFGAEFVATTTALFNSEVLPAYPNFDAMGEPTRPTKHSDSPSAHRSFYLASEQDSLPPSPSSPSYNTGGLYETYSSRNNMFHRSSSLEHPADLPLTYTASYSPGSSSSLTGWAG